MGSTTTVCWWEPRAERRFSSTPAPLQIYDLSAYLLPGSPFSQLTAASDINNTNEFVGVGLVDGVEHGFVVQIVPEPGILGHAGGGWRWNRLPVGPKAVVSQPLVIPLGRPCTVFCVS